MQMEGLFWFIATIYGASNRKRVKDFSSGALSGQLELNWINKLKGERDFPNSHPKLDVYSIDQEEPPSAYPIRET